MRAFRILFSLLVFTSCLTPFADAQITKITDDTATPIPGAGHDYIHMLNETVNPVNGSVSIRIQIPMPKGRQLTIPFGLAYDSNGIHHLLPSTPANAFWASSIGYLSQGGWSYTVPMASTTSSILTVGVAPAPTYNCTLYTNYMFFDPSGGRHQLGLGTEFSGGSGSCANGPNVQQSGDALVMGGLPNTHPDSSNPSATPAFPITVSTADGTVYSFTNITGAHSPDVHSTLQVWLPSQIEDRNGNEIVVTDNSNGKFVLSDTAARPVITSSGFGPSGTTNTITTAAGLTYRITWKTTTANFTVPSNHIATVGSDCNAPGVASDSQVVISQITLPNGKSYKFFYGTDNPDPTLQNSFGLLSEIDYPTGGWIKYQWKLSDSMNEFAAFPGQASGGQIGVANKDGCLYQYKTPVLSTRSVGFGGSSTASESQSFTIYSTQWNAAGTAWTTKSTNVTTTDEVVGKSAVTTYNYTAVNSPLPPFTYTDYPGQIPVESSTRYFDWGNPGRPLRTESKTWFDQFNLEMQQTVLDDNSTSTTKYCYVNPGNTCVPSTVFSQLQRTDQYDFGAPTTSMRSTITTYEAFSGTPGTIANAPCKTVVQDGSSNLAAETDYLYDGNTSLCGTETSAVATLGPGGYTGHDGTVFASTATVPRGNVTQKTQKCFVGATPCVSNSVTSYKYDETGQLLSLTDPRGNTTHYSYTDSYDTTPPKPTDAYLTTITYPPTTGATHVEKFSYAYSDGQLIASTDQNNLQTVYTYNDPLRRLTETQDPDGGKSVIAYNDTAPSPSVSTTKQINATQSVVTVTVMDGVGHPTETQLASDYLQGTVFTDTAYDGFARVHSVSNPHRQGTDPTSTPGTTTYAYDGFGQKVSETYADGSILTTAYCGPSTLVTDPAARWRRSRVDGLGRLVEVDEPNTVGAAVAATGCKANGDPVWITTYSHDTLDNLTGVVQNGSRNRSFTFDSLSRLIASNNPETGTIGYTYDANGNVSTKKDARNITTTYVYDALNRLTNRSYSNSDPSVTLSYDQANCLGLTACSNIGQRTSMTDAAGSEAWAFQVDKANLRNLHVNQRTNASGPLNITKTSTYILDLAGNVTQLTYPTGRIINYAYDSANRPQKAIDASNGITYATGFETAPTGCSTNAVCYTPQGTFYALSIGQSTTFTGLNLTHSYNNRLQPAEFKASSTGGNAIDITYSYVDPATTKNAGQVFSITNNLDTTRSQTFSYDQLNRITAAQSGSTFATSPAHCWGENYTVDPWGNLQSIAATTNTAYTGCSQESGFSRTASVSNQLSGFSYDVSGNTANDGGFAYLWDGESQLKSAGGVTYSYDGDGRRVAKVGSKLYWYGSGGEILAETDALGDLENEYVFFGGKRVAMIPDNAISNGGFESGLQGWTTSGSATIQLLTDPTKAHSGNNYLEMSSLTYDNSSAVSQAIPVSVGQTIYWSG